jgi:hypothetical protein
MPIMLKSLLGHIWVYTIFESQAGLMDQESRSHRNEVVKAQRRDGKEVSTPSNIEGLLIIDTIYNHPYDSAWRRKRESKGKREDTEEDGTRSISEGMTI